MAENGDYVGAVVMGIVAITTYLIGQKQKSK
jgi:hypothetical protein